MVRELKLPVRPLQRCAQSPWMWPPTATGPGPAASWCRVYHRGPRSPTGVSFRTFGPLSRFDPHTCRVAAPGVCPAGRSVLYVGENLATSACEVWGQAQIAQVCPNWRVALVEPSRSLPLQDLLTPGSAMQITALPALGDGESVASCRRRGPVQSTRISRAGRSWALFTAAHTTVVDRLPCGSKQPRT